MPSCLVNRCLSGTGRKGQCKKIILHPFPKELHRIKVWLQQTGQIFYDIDGLAQKILEGNKHNKYRLCSCHFTPDSYLTHDSIRALRADAIPSIFPDAIEGECVISESLKKKRISKKKLLQSTAQSTTVKFTGEEREPVEDFEFKREGFCNIGTQTDYTLSNSIVVVSQIQVPESPVIYNPISTGRYFRSQFMSSPVESQLRIKKTSN